MNTNVCILSLYYLTNPDYADTPVENYRTPLEHALPVIKTMRQESLDDIYAVMKLLKSHGIPMFLESAKYYCDKLQHNYRGYFSIGSGFFSLFKMKENLIQLYSEDYPTDKYVEMLKFFRYINFGIRSVTQLMIEDVVNQRYFYTSLKPFDIQESPFPFENVDMVEFASKQKSFAKTVFGLIDSTAGIDVKLGSMVRNSYDNILQTIDITIKGQRGDGEFRVYIPAMVKGVYSLGNNKFVMSKLYEDYIEGRSTNLLFKLVKSIIEGTTKFSKAYKLSQENIEILRSSLQSGLNSLMFAKRKIMPSNDDIRMEMNFNPATMGKDFETVKEEMMNDAYYFAPFTCISNSESSLSKFETVVEHHKLYFKEYLDAGRFKGSDILKTLGRVGYEKYRGFPNSNKHLAKIDPGYMNNKADFCIAYLSKKNSLIEMNPFYQNMHQSFRAAASAYIIGHAFETVTPHKPLTVNSKIIDMIPSYNMLFAFIDFKDSKGLSAYDGQRLAHEHYAKTLQIKEGYKIAFQGYDKGITRITFDDIYCVVNGVKYPINVASPINIASRKNFSILDEGLYNAKKFFEGKTEQEYRNFEVNPLKKEELMGLTEVFVNGTSIGKHPVCYMQSFFVREIDSSYKNDELVEIDEEEDSTEQRYELPGFKSYKLSLEWFARARLMGVEKTVAYLLGSNADIMDYINKLEISGERNLYKKNGKVTQRFSKEVTGFTSTVTANVNVKPGHARIYLTSSEIRPFLENIKRIDKNYDIERGIRAYHAGKTVILPPALQLRNPSIDDANTVFVEVTVHKASIYAEHGYSEVNPIVWQRQGGDFDGDQVIFLFFPYVFRKELETHFSYLKRNIVEYGFEFAARDLIFGKPEDIYDTTNLHMLASHYTYTDLDSFIEFIGTVKKNAEYGKEIRELANTKLTKREAIVKASSNLFTTRISKQLIGIAKTITMKATFFIEDFMNRFGITDQETKTRLLTKTARMNEKLVQNVIDIQKWSDNLKEVIKTVLLVYRMSEAVSTRIEWEFYPTYRTFAIVRDMALKNGLVEVVDTEKGKFINFTNSLDFVLKLKTVDYKYQDFLYNGLDLEPFARIKKTYTSYIFDSSRAEWKPQSNPLQKANELIDVIDMSKDTYQNILAFTEEDMRSIDVDSLFYVIKKEVTNQ